MSDDVTVNYVIPSLNDALGMGSPANSPRSSLPNEIEFCDDWLHVGGSTFWLTKYFTKVRSSDWFFYSLSIFDWLFQSLSVFDWIFSCCRIFKGNFERITWIRNRSSICCIFFPGRLIIIIFLSQYFNVTFMICLIFKFYTGDCLTNFIFVHSNIFFCNEIRLHIIISFSCCR